MSVESYMTRLRRAAREAMEETGQVLERKFAQEITANKWPWPAQPSPRDIVDTGELRGSYERSTQQAGLNVLTQQHRWTAPHALLVHEGYTGKDGRVYPGRPWTRGPLSEASRILIALWRSKL